jgi:uncharacterized membrane protein YeaQ/YmgE (transglycosylase-associated protein family)
VANVGIAAVVILSLAGLIALLQRFAPGQQGRGTRALIGLVPGLVGTLIVGALAMDFVPDQFESFAMPWVIVAVTCGLILLMIRDLMER